MITKTFQFLGVMGFMGILVTTAAIGAVGGRIKECFDS
jgi:hypothetical protein